MKLKYRAKVPFVSKKARLPLNNQGVEGEGFEPPVLSRVQRFSRPPR